MFVATSQLSLRGVEISYFWSFLDIFLLYAALNYFHLLFIFFGHRGINSRINECVLATWAGLVFRWYARGRVGSRRCSVWTCWRCLAPCQGPGKRGNADSGNKEVWSVLKLFTVDLKWRFDLLFIKAMFLQHLKQLSEVFRDNKICHSFGAKLLVLTGGVQPGRESTARLAGPGSFCFWVPFKFTSPGLPWAKGNRSSDRWL